MNNTIEKQIELKAPVSRVWRALTDHEEFGTWFHTKMSGPFVPGQTTRGQILYPGYEHMLIEFAVQKVEAEHTFSFKWHPYPIDPKVDYAQEEQTLVEFRLEPISTGTRLMVTESGFDKLSSQRYAEAFPMNDDGWTSQLENIEEYVGK